MNKKLMLFNPDELQPRKSSSQDQFEEDFKELLPVFSQIITSAFEKMQEDRRRLHPFVTRGRNWSAGRMHDYIREGILDHELHIFSKEPQGALFLQINGYNIAFKKLGSNYLPSYIPTRASLARLHGKASLYSDDINPIIYVGYRVDEDWLELSGIYAVATKDDETRLWISDLSFLSNNNVDVSTGEETQVEPEVQIRLKSDQLRKKQG